TKREQEQRDFADLDRYLAWNKQLETDVKIIEIIMPSVEVAGARDHSELTGSRQGYAVRSNLARRAAFLETLRLIPAGDDRTLALIPAESQRLMSTLACE